jgi:hypothetical protein
VLSRALFCWRDFCEKSLLGGDTWAKSRILVILTIRSGSFGELRVLGEPPLKTFKMFGSALGVHTKRAGG